MKLTRSMTILMMVGWGMILTAASTPQVDPRILDVLHKVESRINSSDYLSYEMASVQTNSAGKGGESRTTGTVWVKRVPGDDFWGAYVHAKTKNGEFVFDYFYDGEAVYDFDHGSKTCTVIDVGAFENEPNHPGKARISTVPFNPLLIDAAFSQTILSEAESISMRDSEDGQCWIITIKEKPSPAGMKTVATYEVDKKSHEIGRIYTDVNWQGAELKTNRVYTNHNRNEADVAKHVLMPEGYKSDYPQAPFKRGTKTVRWKHEALNGQPAPAFTGKTMEGKALSLDKLKGKVLLLDFWETWCGSCRAAMPKLKALQEKWGDRVHVVGIFTGNAEGAKKIIDYNKLNYPNILADESIHADYKVKAYPTYLLIDKDGKVVAASAGNFDYVKTALEKLLNK